ncbi:hypothetical protein MTO96_022313 [Rhipicephalus appendiculatus]
MQGCRVFEMSLLLLIFSCVAWTVGADKESEPPNIVFILADDLGWADVSMHGSAQIPTPNIDALASTGMVLNNYYVQPLCTPSRAALMSGFYAIHTGFQEGPILPGVPAALSLNFKIMPEYLKDLGYETHILGKPLFLYLAHQATHGGINPTPLEAPDENVAKFPYIGMVDAMDQSIGVVLEALEAESMLENTIIVFSSDNGGSPHGIRAQLRFQLALTRCQADSLGRRRPCKCLRLESTASPWRESLTAAHAHH